MAGGPEDAFGVIGLPGIDFAQEAGLGAIANQGKAGRPRTAGMTCWLVSLANPSFDARSKSVNSRERS